MPTYNKDAYDLSRAFGRIERELISSMTRNMQRHQAEETEYGFDWPQWQALQLQELERYRKDNKDKFSDEFKGINAQIENAIRQAYESGQADQEAAILEAIRSGKLHINKSFDADFFRLNNRRLDALVEATTHDIQKAEHAILRMADDKYRRTIFDAQVYFASGAGTYAKAVDMATHDMLMAGLNCVEYKNGARHTLQDYAEMAIRTAGQRAYLRGEGQKRNEWGIHTVIANKRGNPCPKCAPWCGKVMIDDVYAGATAAEAKASGYPRVSTAMKAGFLHPRCKDTYTTFFPGISQDPKPWTKEELEELEEEARREVEQQHAAKMAEKCDRVAKNSLDPEKQKTYEKRAEQWEEKAESLKSEELTQRRKQRLAERRRNKIQPAFDQMSDGQLRDYIDNDLVTEFIGLDGTNTDFVREAVKVISTFEEMMGGRTIDGLSVQFGGTPKGVLAKYNDKTKTLLLKKTGSIEEFEKSLKSENLRYQRRWKTDKDYHATETFSGTIWHELGHAIDIDTGQALSRSLSADSALDELSVKVSAYAGSTQNVRVTKRSEAWAENFAAYMDGGRNKKRVPKQIEEKIKGYFEQKAANENKKRYMSLGKSNIDDNIPKGRKLSRAEKDNLMAYAKERRINIHGISKFDGDSDILKSVMDEIYSHKSLFPRVFSGKRITIAFDDMNSGTYAATDKKTITLNRMFFRNREFTESDLTQSGKFSCTTIEGIARHELGHILEAVHGEKGLQFAREVYYNIHKRSVEIDELVNYIREEVSSYAFPKTVDEITGEVFLNTHEITSEVLSSTKESKFILLMKEKWLKEGLR